MQKKIRWAIMSNWIVHVLVWNAVVETLAVLTALGNHRITPTTQPGRGCAGKLLPRVVSQAGRGGNQISMCRIAIGRRTTDELLGRSRGRTYQDSQRLGRGQGKGGKGRRRESEMEVSEQRPFCCDDRLQKRPLPLPDTLVPLTVPVWPGGSPSLTPQGEKWRSCRDVTPAFAVCRGHRPARATDGTC